MPVTAPMSAWFWQHNNWLGTYREALPRRRRGDAVNIAADQLPVAVFDEGDQEPSTAPSRRPQRAPVVEEVHAGHPRGPHRPDR